MDSIINKRISIIVPIYKVEKYLKKCIESILCQTHKNIELILVDDGSPDNCPRICDEYALKDARIKVLHKKNGGLSDARNYGLKFATGEYIGFVDSDDFIEPGMYEYLIKGMVNNQCLLGECGVKCIFNDKIIVKNSKKSYVLNKNEAIKKYYSSKAVNKFPRTAVWSKLFHNSLLKNKKFPKGHIHEDYYLVMQCMVEADKIFYIEKPLYNHIYTNSMSITSSKFNEKDLYKEVQFKKVYQYLDKLNMKEEAMLAKKDYYNLCLQFYYRCYYSNMKDYKKYLMIIKKDYEIIKSLDYNFKERNQLKLAVNIPKLYLIIRLLKKNV